MGLTRIQIARAKAKYSMKVVNNLPKKRKLRPRIRRQRFMAALFDSCGILTVIGERLGCTAATVKRYLDRPDWADIREMWEEEREKLICLAECRIKKVLENNSPSMAQVSAQTARWVLSRLAKDRYGDTKRMVLEGGDKPIEVNNKQVSIDSLDLPLEVRKTLLEAMEKQEGNGDSQ